MPNPISPQQLAAFARDGFLVVPNVIDPATLSAVRAAFCRRVADLLARVRKLAAAVPAVPAPRGELGADLTALLQAAPDAYQHIDISLPMVADMRPCAAKWRALFGAAWREEAGVFAAPCIHRLLTHPNVAAIVRQLVGAEAVASPVQHTRIKPPQANLPGAAQIDANTARTLWHQDEGVVSEAARGVNILTVWLALTDATEKNGCMEAVAGSHLAPDAAARRDFGLAAHCPGKGAMVGEIYIPEAQIDRQKTRLLTARAGDAVLLHKRVIHGAGANRSADIRWSFDLRYQPAGTPTGRDFFPAFRAVSARHKIGGAADYKRGWLAARDAILQGEQQAVFNTRWNKYGNAEMCA